MEKWKTVRVVIRESEKGWGDKIIERKEFKTRIEAEKFVKEYNKDNPKDYVPDYYIQAEIVD